MIIYKTTNLLNNKIYIGQDTKNNPMYFGSGNLIKKAIKKYGRENFHKVILESDITSIEILNEREIYWISYWSNLVGRENMYNIESGGYYGGLRGSENKGKMRPVSIDGNLYESVKEASEKTKFNYRTIISRIKSKNNFSLWFYLDTPKEVKEYEDHGKGIYVKRSNSILYKCDKCNREGKGNGFKSYHFRNCGKKRPMTDEQKIKISNKLKNRKSL